MPKFDIQFKITYTDRVAVEAANKIEARRLLEDRLRDLNNQGIPILKESAISTVELFLDDDDESTLSIDIIQIEKY